MVVILEFTVAVEDFLLGETVDRATDVESIELERVIPLEDESIPFLWVVTDDFEAFEESVRAQESVASVERMGAVDRHGLYRIEWREAPQHQLVAGLIDAGGTLLEAQSGDRWLFRVRFQSHAGVAQFYNFCTRAEVPIRVERVLPLQQDATGPLFDLSDEQREALLLAFERGYFETPREASLDDLAGELGISQQALSDRIRRGVRSVVGDSFATSPAQ